LNQSYQLVSAAIAEMDTGVDIENRRVYLSGEIFLEDALYLLQRINLINKLNPSEEEVAKPIELFINSAGGSVYAMFSIIDTIQNCPSPIITIGTGQIMSAATLILAAGTGGRYLTKNSSVMNHEMSDYIFGKASDITLQAEHTKTLEKRC